MKNWIKENWFRIVSPIVVIIAFYFLFYNQPHKQDSLSKISERPYKSSPILTTGDITCTYPQIMHARYHENKITYEIPPFEKNPNIFTFTDLQSKESKLRYIDATQTISEVRIVLLSEDEERLVFAEMGGAYVSTHTIFKELGISLYSKEVSLLGIPSGTMAIGTCIDS